MFSPMAAYTWTPCPAFCGVVFASDVAVMQFAEALGPTQILAVSVKGPPNPAVMKFSEELGFALGLEVYCVKLALLSQHPALMLEIIFTWQVMMPILAPLASVEASRAGIGFVKVIPK